MIAVKQERKWDKVNFEYLDKLYRDDETGELIDLLKACDELVSNENISKVTITDYLSPDDFVKKIFMQNSAFNIPISETKYGNQQFVLTTTAIKGGDTDTFSMEYSLLNPDQGHSSGLPNLHFAIEVIDEDGSQSLLPLTWCGKPTYDKLGKRLNWGNIDFYVTERSEFDLIPSSGGPFEYIVRFDIDEDDRCQLIAFLLS